jgi:hypothetical protein
MIIQQKRPACLLYSFGNGVCNSPTELPGGIYADRGCPVDCEDVRDATVEVLLSGS